jgi:signal transduction histidine kinase
MLERVFLNLSENGIAAMQSSGVLRVSTRGIAGLVEVSFRDTGIGISRENLDNIFKPLFSTKSKGLGLGLPICRKFVEAHGGNIEAESELGKGTEFRIKLPIHQTSVDDQKTED